MDSAKYCRQNILLTSVFICEVFYYFFSGNGRLNKVVIVIMKIYVIFYQNEIPHGRLVNYIY